MRIGLFWKVFGSYVGLVLASALIVGVFASGPANEESRQEFEIFLESKLGLIEGYFRQSLATDTFDQFVGTINGLDERARYTVVAPDGTVLGERVLLHPHVDEQPFTRSLGGVEVPADVTSVTIRAHCGVDGLGGAEIEVTLPR